MEGLKRNGAKIACAMVMLFCCLTSAADRGCLCTFDRQSNAGTCSNAYPCSITHCVAFSNTVANFACCIAFAIAVAHSVSCYG